MFERFYAAFQSEDDGTSPTDPRQPWPHGSVVGFSELMSTCSRCTFNGGLYRLHSQRSGQRADQLVSLAFPENASNAYCFGYDWMGCQFALDGDRIEAGEPLVLLLDPATGSAFEVDFTFSAFHNQLLVDEPDRALAASIFKEWGDANPTMLPLGKSNCVGFRIPLFLGGKDEPSNYEVMDIEVYWSLSGQLRRSAQGLPNGTKIVDVEIQRG